MGRTAVWGWEIPAGKFQSLPPSRAVEPALKEARGQKGLSDLGPALMPALASDTQRTPVFTSLISKRLNQTPQVL